MHFEAFFFTNICSAPGALVTFDQPRDVRNSRESQFRSKQSAGFGTKSFSFKKSIVDLQFPHSERRHKADDFLFFFLVVMDWSIAQFVSYHVVYHVAEQLSYRTQTAEEICNR